MTLKPKEDDIHNKLFLEILPKRYPDSVIAKNWLGWSYREQDRKEQTHFYREFDVALFERKTQATIHTLILTGFEVKGFEEKSGKPPSFAEGIDQCLVLLYQGADFAYLVYPEPERKEDQKALKELCDKYAPYVGLIFVPHDLDTFSQYYATYRNSMHNPHSRPDRKRHMLSGLVTSGLRDEISQIPSWCKKQEY